MKNDVKSFIALRARLESEYASLKQRLQEIDTALGKTVAAPPAAIRRGPGRPARNAGGIGMRDAIAMAVKNSPKSIAELVETMPSFGYKFVSKNPKNSVGAYLYGPGKQHFKNSNGRFTAR